MMSLPVSDGESAQQDARAEKRDGAQKPPGAEETDRVVVSAAALIGWDDYLTRSMQRQYRIIQALKEHRSRTERRASTRAASTNRSSEAERSEAQPPDAELVNYGGMTLNEAHEAIVRERCEELRPDTSWAEIAGTLGISDKTLWEHRREIFDSSHKFHPDRSPYSQSE